MKGIVLALLLGIAQGDDTLVVLNKGRLRGERVDLDFGEYYYAYRGVPYAKPPVKELRFKDPVEFDFWGIIDAVEDGHICPQFDIGQGKPVGDENCLTLNVYTPKLDSKKRAVMVYFHGGSFVMGGGSSLYFGPETLIEKDVVVVTFNYRLGPMGFLTTADKAASGNQGVKDQIMALKWVKDNIDRFGGNPEKITLFGEDSGAASITIMAMSPLAQGLFSGAIAMSGNALCDQFIQSNPEEAALELASRLECNTESGETILRCLNKLTQQEIIKISQDMFMFWSFPRWFAPSVDGVVLPDKPENLLASGKFAKVPFMVGQTKDEGAAFYRLTINAFNNGRYDDNFVDNKLPRLLPVLSDFNSKLYPMTRLIRKKYFTNVDMEVEEEFRPRYINFLTDLLFSRCTDRFTSILTKYSVPAYEYSFDYRGQYSVVNLQGEQVDMGVAHGDDVQYVFQHIWGGDLEMSSSDSKFSKNVYTTLLTNFAKTSVPTPTIDEFISVSWPPVSPSLHNVMRINTKLKLETDFNKERRRFWSETIPDLFKASGKKAKSEL